MICRARRIGTSRRPASGPVSASSGGRRRPTTCSWNRRAFRSSAASASARCRTCRWRRGSGWAAGHLHPASRHRRQMGLLCRRGAGRRRAECRAASLRGSLLRRRGPRHHRGLARSRQQAACVRMAGRLAVLDPGECLAPHRQCEFQPGAAARRHHGAEPDEPRQQCRRDVQLPVRVPRPVLGRRRLLQIQGRYRARSGARPCHAAHQFHSRHRQLRPAARQSPLARLPPRRAVHDQQHASICGSASTRPAAIPRRMRTPRRRC